MRGSNCDKCTETEVRSVLTTNEAAAEYLTRAPVLVLVSRLYSNAFATAEAMQPS
jgi:hypothetical protein